MESYNSLMRGLFDAVMAPLAGTSPWWSLTVLSLLLAVVALLVVRATSDQERVEAAKRRIHAGLFEIRLFNDDPPIIFKALGAIFKANFIYVGLMFVPFLWILPPMFLLFAQLQPFYGYQGLPPGKTVLVEAVLAEGWNGDPALVGEAGKPVVHLQAPDGVDVETAAMWIPQSRELTWRVTAHQPGRYELHLMVGNQTYPKSLVVSEEPLLRRSPLRLARGFTNQLLYPFEPALPGGSPVSSITFTYPAGMSFLGWDSEWAWMMWVLVLSLVFGLVLRKPLKVTI
jgi:uncharacterized membrane protein (DUF106 family)